MTLFLDKNTLPIQEKTSLLESRIHKFSNTPTEIHSLCSNKETLDDQPSQKRLSEHTSRASIDDSVGEYFQTSQSLHTDSLNV